MVWQQPRAGDAAMRLVCVCVCVCHRIAAMQPCAHARGRSWPGEGTCDCWAEQKQKHEPPHPFVDDPAVNATHPALCPPPHVGLGSAHVPYPLVGRRLASVCELQVLDLCESVSVCALANTRYVICRPTRTVTAVALKQRLPPGHDIIRPPHFHGSEPWQKRRPRTHTHTHIPKYTYHHHHHHSFLGCARTQRAHVRTCARTH